MIIHNAKLKNGYEVQIAPLHGGVNIKQITDFVNGLVEERLFISRDEKTSTREQSMHIGIHKAKIKQGLTEYLIALHGKQIIAQAIAERFEHRVRGNVFIRLYVAGKYRRLGLGEKMMQLLLARLKRKKGLVNAYIEVAEKNLPAIKFYRKLGFRKIALLPNWMEYDGGYINAVAMIMDLKKHLQKART